MLVETMTTKEMLDELHKDKDFLDDNDRRFLDKGGIRHLRRPHAKFPAYVMHEAKSPRGNKYLCYFLFNKRGDVFKNKVSVLRTAIIQTKEGLATASFVYSGIYGKEILYYYRPHVFKRYKERMHLELDGIELIKYFDMRNADTVRHNDYKHKEGDIENDIMLTTYDGALFGTVKEEDGRVCCYLSTFIANDTMQEGYKSKFNSKHNEAIDEIVFFEKLGPGYTTNFRKRNE